VKPIMEPKKIFQVNRRAFLRGAGGVAIGLPFLESLPERSAWAADAPPTFALFMVAACGVVPGKFLPAAKGALTDDGLKSSGKAVSALHAHAANLLMLQANYPMSGVTGCGHAQGLVQALTAKNSQGSGGNTYSSGPSADVVIGKAFGADPLTLYAGNKKNGYIVERVSFKASGAGQVRSADDNPYTLYAKLVGLTTSTGTQTPTQSNTASELAATRKSVNDLVKAELNALKAMSVLSKADRDRLDQHFQGIRDVETTMGGMAAQAGPSCSTTGLDQTTLDKWKSGFAFTTNGMIEDVARLHMQIVALAFGCAYNRVATMQWGDGTDQTRYNVASNASLGWPFHHLSHRVQSDSQSGSNPTAEAAHAEVDALRMTTLAAGLDAFAQRGLADKSIVLWTNHVAEGPNHSFKNLPYIIWGNGGGYIKNGQFIDSGGAGNGKVLNTIIKAVTKDKPATLTDFGDGTGGELAAMKV
jgi:hypothetical protein